MSKINVYGFDMDYTLVEYTRALPGLVYRLARDHLVTRMNYPEVQLPACAAPTPYCRACMHVFVLTRLCLTCLLMPRP